MCTLFFPIFIGCKSDNSNVRTFLSPARNLSKFRPLPTKRLVPPLKDRSEDMEKKGRSGGYRLYSTLPRGELKLSKTAGAKVARVLKQAAKGVSFSLFSVVLLLLLSSFLRFRHARFFWFCVRARAPVQPQGSGRQRREAHQRTSGKKTEEGGGPDHQTKRFVPLVLRLKSRLSVSSCSEQGL